MKVKTIGDNVECSGSQSTTSESLTRNMLFYIKIWKKTIGNATEAAS